ncbi:MAG: YaiI/YqxD family protein [Spirochaetes bacterium]|nr:MAG: YaiI/YqxD family protein [Spirochaetota bacterium]
MQILIDADATPVVIKEILFKAAERNRIPLILVANQPMKSPESQFISSIIVAAGPDEADDRIAEIARPGDLVITADIPLADRVVTRGAFALNPRGEFYTRENIKERLAMRDLMDDLRSSGISTGNQAAFSSRDRQKFANQLDRFLTKHKKSTDADD